MSSKSFRLSKEDPVVQQFRSGLDLWERPFNVSSPVGSIRVRGAVGASRQIRVRGPAKLQASILSEDDPILEQFRTGLESWERPFEAGSLGYSDPT